VPIIKTGIGNIQFFLPKFRFIFFPLSAVIYFNPDSLTLIPATAESMSAI
jgi:hypothetical protein